MDAGTERYAIVPDSSSIHAVDPRFDGKRMVVACTKEHLAALVKEYRQRPFADAELWAGEIARAIEAQMERSSRTSCLGRPASLRLRSGRG